MEYILRKVEREDLCMIAKLHKRIFSDHLLGQLPIFLIKAFYLSYYQCYVDRKRILFNGCFQKDGSLLGFVLGGESNALNQAKKNFLRRNLFLIFCSSLFNFRIYPFLLDKVVLLLKNDKIGERGKQPSFRLLSIGVTPEYQGKRISSLLLNQFEKAAFAEVQVFGLSVHISNKRAIAFYQKNGFLFSGENSISYFMQKTKDSI